MARKVNVLLIGDNESENDYSKFLNAIKQCPSRDKINLKQLPSLPETVGTKSFETDCIIDDADIILFTTPKYAEETKKTFIMEHATKSISVVLPGKAGKFLASTKFPFTQKLINYHENHYKRLSASK